MDEGHPMLVPRTTTQNQILYLLANALLVLLRSDGTFPSDLASSGEDRQMHLRQDLVCDVFRFRGVLALRMPTLFSGDRDHPVANVSLQRSTWLRNKTHLHASGSLPHDLFCVAIVAHLEMLSSSLKNLLKSLVRAGTLE